MGINSPTLIVIRRRMTKLQREIEAERDPMMRAVSRLAFVQMQIRVYELMGKLEAGQRLQADLDHVVDQIHRLGVEE